MLFRVILQCETPTKFTPEPRTRRVGPKRRGRARESGSRFVDMNDQWTFQCQIQNPPPPSRRNVDRRNDRQPRPTSAASRTKPRACIWTSMFPALWSVRHVCQCQTYDYESQCATGFVKVTSVSLACGITNKSRRFNLAEHDLEEDFHRVVVELQVGEVCECEQDVEVWMAHLGSDLDAAVELD